VHINEGGKKNFEGLKVFGLISNELYKTAYSQNRSQALPQLFDGRVIGPEHLAHTAFKGTVRVSDAFVEVGWEVAGFERVESFVAFHSCRSH